MQSPLPKNIDQYCCVVISVGIQLGGRSGRTAHIRKIIRRLRCPPTPSKTASPRRQQPGRSCAVQRWAPRSCPWPKLVPRQRLRTRHRRVTALSWWSDAYAIGGSAAAIRGDSARVDATASAVRRSGMQYSAAGDVLFGGVGGRGTWFEPARDKKVKLASYST